MPSIASRLARALLLWALVWGAAVGGAVWLAAASEVDELLDEGLVSSASLLAVLVQANPTYVSGPEGFNSKFKDFAWQLVNVDGTLSLRSSLAPAEPWQRTPRAGFTQAGGWRLYGLAVPADDGTVRMLYAAQTRSERAEVRAEVGISAALSAFAVGLLGQIWLRGRVRAELLPLQALSLRLGQLDFDASQPGTSLGLPERRELAPVHAAVDGLMTRLAARIGNEQAFSAHAAHALRTPLAGIDAQLALALREAPPPLAARLQRVRDAAGRLQGVVAALLGLFRAGTGLERVAVDLHALLARLPTASLRVSVEDRPHGSQLQADADLLSAALMNLLDNSQRHGAQHVVVSLSAAQTLRVQDDGPGVTAGRRQQLQAALDGQSYEGQTGLGLMLADRVARAHGGGVRLLPPPEHSTGLTVELTL